MLIASLPAQAQDGERGKPLPEVAPTPPSQMDGAPEGYVIETLSGDPPRLEIQHGDDPIYVYTYVAPFPGLYPRPPADLTGNGEANLVIADQVSRSTTDYTVLELGPEGVSELAAFPGVWFYQDLEFVDSDGDGIAEPTVIGELR